MFRLTLVMTALILPLVTLPSSEVRTQESAVDPGWEGLRNRLLPDPLPTVRQSFGYCATRHAGGRKAGEIGGWVQRSATPASYARAIPLRTLQDRLTASGKFAVTRADGSSGMLFGWFHDTSRGWRTPNSLAFRLDGNGGKYWVLFEYGTRNLRAGGGATFEGRYQTTKTQPFLADGTVHEWTLTYEPTGNENNGAILFTLDGKTHRAPLAPGHKADGAMFNRFGIWNAQNTGKGLEVYFDDVRVENVTEGFDEDPRWLAQGNEGTFPERFVRPRHDFGFSPSAHAGGKPGEIGGIIWRDTQAAYYADRVGPFTLDDELSASGRVVLSKASSDSGVTFGWFDAATYQALSKERARQITKRNLLGIAIEGPSRVGHYFRPEYAMKTGAGKSKQDGPVILPNGKPHTWTLHYEPRGASGIGRITFRLDDMEQTLDLEPGHRKLGASLDRFGILACQSADGHAVELYLDDLKYSASPPARR